MSDDQVRALLTRALPNPSPLSPSAQQDVLGRGRRELRRRRALTAGAGLIGTAVLVAGIAVAPNLIGGGAGSGAGIGVGAAPSAGPSSVAGSPTPTTSASPPGDGTMVPATGSPPDYHADAATAQRLTTALRGAMTEALPGSTFANDPGRHWPAFELRPQPGYYLGGAWVTDAAGAGNVTVVVTRQAEVWDCRPEYTTGTVGLVSCADGTGPSGERWNYQVINDANNGRPNLLVYQLTLGKADGTHIQINAENTTTVKNASGTISRPTPPMTKDQMLAVALTAGLSLTP